MLDSQIEKLMLGLSAAALTLALATPPAQAAATIKVAVDSIFANTANELVSAFQYAYPTAGYSVVVTTADSASLEAEILSGGAAYDLFLAGSGKQPIDLAANHPAMVVGSPFKYAEDFLALFSKTVDVSHGLPFPLGAKVMLPDPAADPYGAIAARLISSPPWFVWRIPGPRSAVAPDAGTSLAAIDSGTYAFGFVANSSICSLDANGAPSYEPGTYRHVYALDPDATHRRRSWHLWRSLFRGHEIDGSVFLTGVKLAAARTADQETELDNFLAFLTGTANVSGAVSTAGTELIEGHCFEIPVIP